MGGRKFEILMVKPCQSGKAFDVRLKCEKKLDLASAASKLAGFCKMKAETPVVLIAECGKHEITVYANCKLLVKNAESEDEARAAADRIYSAII